MGTRRTATEARDHAKTAAGHAEAASGHAKTAAGQAEAILAAITAHKEETRRSVQATVNVRDDIRDLAAALDAYHKDAERLMARAAGNEKLQADYDRVFAQGGRLAGELEEALRENAALRAAAAELRDENLALRGTRTGTGGAPEPAGQNGEAGTAGPAAIKPARTRKTAAKGSEAEVS